MSAATTAAAAAAAVVVVSVATAAGDGVVERVEEGRSVGDAAEQQERAEDRQETHRGRVQRNCVNQLAVSAASVCGSSLRWRLITNDAGRSRRRLIYRPRIIRLGDNTGARAPGSRSAPWNRIETH